LTIMYFFTFWCCYDFWQLDKKMILTGESSCCAPKITLIWLKTNELENNCYICIPTNLFVFSFIIKILLSLS